MYLFCSVNRKVYSVHWKQRKISDNSLSPQYLQFGPIRQIICGTIKAILERVSVVIFSLFFLDLCRSVKFCLADKKVSFLWIVLNWFCGVPDFYYNLLGKIGILEKYTIMQLVIFVPLLWFFLKIKVIFFQNTEHFEYILSHLTLSAKLLLGIIHWNHSRVHFVHFD